MRSSKGTAFEIPDFLNKTNRGNPQITCDKELAEAAG
jgi:hypothetical protein